MRARVSALVLASALVGSAVVLAVPGRAAAHIPHDVITQVLVSPDFRNDATVFAIARGHLVRSANGGASWTEIVNGFDQPMPNQIAIARSNKSVMYIAAPFGGVYRSADAGLSWARTKSTSAMQSTSLVAVSPTDSNTVLAAGTTSGVFRTVDGGNTWSTLATSGRTTALLFTASGRVITGNDGGVVSVSDDAGTTWSPASGTSGTGAITALASGPTATGSATVLAGTATGRLLRSTDAGLSFAGVGTGLPVEPVTSIALSPSYPASTNMWVTTYASGVFWSNNTGSTFSKRSVGLTTDAQADELASPQFANVSAGVAANGSTVLFVAGFDGLFRSDDSALHWRELQTLTEYVTGLAVSPDYAHDGTLLATTYVKGAYMSTDGGATWRPRDVGLGSPSGSKFAPIYRMFDVAFSPNYASDGTIFTANWWNVLKSTDRGASWTPSTVGTLPASTLRQFVIAVSPAYATDRTVYVGTRQGEIYRSTAQGATNSWTLLSNVGDYIRSIVIDPQFSTHPVMYVGAHNGVFRSDDGGVQWQATGPKKLSLLAMSPQYETDGTVYAGTDSGLFVTRDKGQTWNEVFVTSPTTHASVEALGVSPAYDTDGTVFVSVLGKGLYRSTDFGATFTATGVATLLANNHLIADFENPASEPLQFSPAYATDHTLFGFAQTTVVKSTDGGDTWQEINLPPAADMLQPPLVIAPAGTAHHREGDTAHKLMIPIDLEHPYTAPVTVPWKTADVPGNPNWATSGSDYVAANGTLTYPVGATRQYIAVTVNDDTVHESSESVLVALGTPTNAKIGVPLGLVAGIIDDDDPAPAP